MLSGCRILVTALRRAVELGSELVGRGADVVAVPTLGPAAPPDDGSLVAATRALLARPPDTVVVTTATGFEAWQDAVSRAALEQPWHAMLSGARVIARGPKAQAAVRAAGLTDDWVAGSETQAELVRLLLDEGVTGLRIALLPYGAGGSCAAGPLAAGGAEVVTLPGYAHGPPPRPAVLATAADDLAAGRFDAVTFTSAAAAAGWWDAVAQRAATRAVRERVDRGELLLAAVGPLTAEPLRYDGLAVAVAAEPRLGGLVRLVVHELGGDAHALTTRHGRLRVRAGTATLDHRRVRLSPGGLAVLRRLAASPGHVVSRDELLRALPGDSTDPHTAEVAVARLREALRGAVGDDSLVRTVVRRGYLLAAR